MREIKFRAWLGDKMQYGVVPFQWDYALDRMWHKCIESNGDGIFGSGGTEAKFEVGGFSIRNGALMQYTGLKDKNGKEIYEGDVVKFRGGRKPRNEDRGYVTSEVVFRSGMFTVKENKSIFMDFAILNVCEIIGNIYENPELIQNKTLLNNEQGEVRG